MRLNKNVVLALFPSASPVSIMEESPSFHDVESQGNTLWQQGTEVIFLKQFFFLESLLQIHLTFDGSANDNMNYSAAVNAEPQQ